MRNIQVWNQTTVGKIAWYIHILQESLWVKRVHGVYTKGGRWEIFNAPPTASWIIKKLCAVTTVFRQWICNTVYSIKEVYEHTLMTQHKVHWRNLVWNRISIPKTRFLCWLAARYGLKTKEKLYQLGMVVGDVCPLCGLYPETYNHLFFKCTFSRSCMKTVKSCIGITLKLIARMDFGKQSISKIKQHVLNAIFACILYHIWKCRNEAVWYAYVRSMFLP